MNFRLLLCSLSCFLLALAGALSLTSCSAGDGADVLLIYSPHGADIQYEFTRGFEEWHLKKYGRAAHVKFIDVGGGTGVIVNTLTAKHNQGVPPDADMMFGGGSAVFDGLLRQGFLEAPEPPIPAEVISKIPAKIPDTDYGVVMGQYENSAAATQPAEMGRPMWVAATTSYFGIVVNKQRAAELNIPIPPHMAWADVTSKEWFGNLSIADPSKSGSVKTCLEMMLQQYHWKEGWPILVKMYANAETVKPGGSMPADETASAAAAGGIVIDFFGRIAVVKCGPDIAQFIVPEGGAQLDADPIAVLKGAKHKELASHMMEFVISPEGQRLWTHRAGTPGGPAKKALGRMSLLKELYDKEADLMTDPFNPFTAGSPLKIEQNLQRDRTVILGDLVKYTLVDNHDLLVQARKAVLDAGDPPELLSMFDALPFPEEALTSTDPNVNIARQYSKMGNEPSSATEARIAAIRRGWSDKYRNEFQDIIAKAKAYKAAH